MIMLLLLFLATSSESLRAAPAQPYVEPCGILRTRSGRLAIDRSPAGPARARTVQQLMASASPEAALARAAHRVGDGEPLSPTRTENFFRDEDRLLRDEGAHGGAPAPGQQDVDEFGPLRTSELRSAELTRSLSDGMHSPARSPCRERAPMVFLSRHGQSQANVMNIVGMDMGLSNAGERYAKRLGQWVQGNLGLDGDDITIFRSDMVRTTQTVDGIVQGLRGGHRLEVRSQLNEIHAGAIEGWTVTEFRQQAGKEYQARKSDKLRYRYPGGESYIDLLHRVDPVVKEIQQYGREGKDVLVVAHQATLRCVVARLTGLTDSDVTAVPSINIPLHTIVHLQRERPYDDEEPLKAKGKYSVIGNLPLGA